MLEKAEDNKKETIHYKLGISNSGFEQLNRFVEMVNKNSKRRVKVSDVLSYAVAKLREQDIPEILERVYTASDRIEMLLERVNSENPEQQLTKEQLLGKMLETFEDQNKRRPSKIQKVRE